MAPHVVRTMISIPTDLLDVADQLVRSGKARSRNDLLITALRRELAARERADIDAAFAEMAHDPEYQAEATAIADEFAVADWEALRYAEGAK